MIRALALDDEPLALRLLGVYADRIPDLEIVGYCTSIAEAAPLAGNVDLIFADINMPDMSGMEFVSSLEDPPLVVFTTAYADYAVEAFRVRAVDYLLKPFTFKEFSEAVGRVRGLISDRAHSAEAHEGGEQMLFKSGRRLYSLNTADIRYVEGFGPYLKLFTAADASPVIILSSFSQIQQRLSGGAFVRVHKSYMVNMAHVRSAGSKSLTMDDGVSLPVGEMYRATFLQKYTDKVF